MIIAHVAAENPIAARRIGRNLLAAGDSLADLPQRGRPGRVSGTRELVSVWPYIIVYETGPTGIIRILRVWHGAQERS